MGRTLAAAASVSSTPKPAAPVLSTTLELPPGGDVTAVAHLKEGGDLMLSAFLNDTRSALTNNGRLVVRHLADAPAVDIVANGALTLFENVTNPNEGQVDVPAGTYGVTINAAGTSTVAFDAGDLTLPAGKSTIVYAVGSLGGGTVSSQSLFRLSNRKKHRWKGSTFRCKPRNFRISSTLQAASNRAKEDTTLGRVAT